VPTSFPSPLAGEGKGGGEMRNLRMVGHCLMRDISFLFIHIPHSAIEKLELICAFSIRNPQSEIRN
jgi:hypothetical protein